MEEKPRTQRRMIRVAGKLREIVIVRDEKGTIIHKFMRPVMVEFYLRDVIQVAIGAALLGIPIAFTEEVWTLGESLPQLNIIILALLSLSLIGLFVYYNYYRTQFKTHWVEFAKRVISTYVISFLIVTLLLFLIEAAPWGTDPQVAFARTVLVAFPASMSATVVDIIK